MKILCGRGLHLILPTTYFCHSFLATLKPVFPLGQMTALEEKLLTQRPAFDVSHMQGGSGGTVLLGRPVVFLDFRCF